MKKLLFTLCWIFAFSAALSALTLEENLTFDLKGECTMGSVLIVPDDIMGLFKGTVKALGGGDCFDETAVRGWLKDCPGVSIESCRIFQRDSARMLQLILQIKDCSQNFNSAAFGNYLSLKPSPAMPGDLIFTAALPQLSGSLKAEDSRRLGALIQLLGGLKIVIRVNTPTAILETTGTRTAFNQAVWKLDERCLTGEQPLPEIRVRW